MYSCMTERDANSVRPQLPNYLFKSTISLEVETPFLVLHNFHSQPNRYFLVLQNSWLATL